MADRQKPIVYFDLDDTFLLNAYAFRPAIETCLHLSVSMKEVKRLYHFFRLESENISNQNYENGIFLRYLPKDRWRLLCEKLDKEWTPLLLEQLEQVYKEKQRQLSLSEETKRLLEKMRQCKIEMGIITNGGIKNQMEKYDQLQLSNYIPKNKVYISEVVGFSKPDLKIFSFVEEKISRHFNQPMYYVGDSLKNDIYPLENTRWQPIWFNYLEIERPKNIPLIYSMDELPFLIWA